MGTRRRGERLIQIFPEWPARYGSVLEAGSGARRTAVLVEWDDGRQDWIHTAEFRRLRILFVSDEKPAFEPKAGPLETLLSSYMGGDGERIPRATTADERSAPRRTQAGLPNVPQAEKRSDDAV